MGHMPLYPLMLPRGRHRNLQFRDTSFSQPMPTEALVFTLANAIHEHQRTLLVEHMYPLVADHLEYENTTKVTCMLLEMDQTEQFPTTATTTTATGWKLKVNNNVTGQKLEVNNGATGWKLEIDVATKV
ncbi:hypothetical protein Dsin_006466 [Dipteronia sinensis]|uniref:PABC domain-containing protein n=1 Tax=Dipteronia sinensis TaxID=43782 RepID=A0AAE0AZU0_9ROSI|nr:hypothetical protein Dsin_006466 [Dipteronia sinensis]